VKQIVRKGLRRIIVDEVPDPLVIPHHVVVRPVYTLISSGTETASIHQEAILKEVAGNPSHLQKVWSALKVNGPWRTFQEVKAKFSEYAVLGYSGAGIVVDRHPTVQDLDIGQRVAYGGEGAGHAEYVLVGRNLVARLPDSVPFEHGCFAALGSIALNAVRIAAITIGDVVAVIGLGLVGQLICQLVRCQGGRVIAIDLRPERLELARKLGAEHCLLAGDASPEAANALTAGNGADSVIIAAAVDFSFPWEQMYRKEIQLFMARAYGPGSYDEKYEKQGQDYPLAYVRWTENRNMEEFLRAVGEQRVRIQEIVTHEFSLDDATKAYETILDPSSGSLGVVLRYPSPPCEPETTCLRMLESARTLAPLNIDWEGVLS